MYCFILQIAAKTQNKIPFPKAEPSTNGVDVNKKQGKPPEESDGKNKDKDNEDIKSEEEKVDTKVEDKNTVDKSKVKNDQNNKEKETQQKERLNNDKANETKDNEKLNETKDKAAKQADTEDHCDKDRENGNGKEKNKVIESKDKEDDIKDPKKVDTAKADNDSKEDLELIVSLTHSWTWLPFYTPRKHLESFVSLMFSGDMKMDQWHEMMQELHKLKLDKFVVCCTKCVYC